MPDEMIPDELRQKLRDRGHRMLQIGDIRMDLETGVVRRSVLLDNRPVGFVEGHGLTIPWDDVAKLIEVSDVS